MLSSTLLLLSLILLPVLALLAGVMYIVQHRSGSNVELNRGGPIRYSIGDRVYITHGGDLLEGMLFKWGESKPGQSPLERPVVIRVRQVDTQGNLSCVDVVKPCWQIKGRLGTK
jgi:hypothetical protein